MTNKQQQEKILDLERRIVLLEGELIRFLIGGNNTPSAQVQYNTCQMCGQSYPSTNIHVCPNNGLQYYTTSSALSGNSIKNTAGSAIPNNINTSGFAQLANIKPNGPQQNYWNCSCGWRNIDPMTTAIPICASCGRHKP